MSKKTASIVALTAFAASMWLAYKSAWYNMIDEGLLCMVMAGLAVLFIIAFAVLLSKTLEKGSWNVNVAVLTLIGIIAGGLTAVWTWDAEKGNVAGAMADKELEEMAKESTCGVKLERVDDETAVLTVVDEGVYDRFPADHTGLYLSYLRALYLADLNAEKLYNGVMRPMEGDLRMFEVCAKSTCKKLVIRFANTKGDRYDVELLTADIRSAMENKTPICQDRMLETCISLKRSLGNSGVSGFFVESLEYDRRNVNLEYRQEGGDPLTDDNVHDAALAALDSDQMLLISAYNTGRGFSIKGRSGEREFPPCSLTNAQVKKLIESKRAK